ncbi:MAG: DUF86 domain-containing protein [Actinobacteria bacterium]|nr:DUF86 domain-containing protein [Actinomycetota bacterium]MCG2808637.1 DUF86 domain-containing protein [Coriobacteriia bacterium]
MRDPEASLVDIVTYSDRALGYIGGQDLRTFLQDTGAQDKVIRCLEVIGEAAKRIPATERAKYPRVPWAQMAGMRNRLAHEYDAVDMESVWLTVAHDLPAILAELPSPGESNPHD